MHEFIKMKFNLREGEQFPQGHSSLSYLPVLGLQLRHTGSLVVAREILAVARGIRFPDQRSNPGPLHWDYGILTTGPQENPSWFVFYTGILTLHAPTSLAVFQDLKFTKRFLAWLRII